MAERGFRIITPEAAELELDTAGIASRVLAAWIDLFIIYMVLYAATTLFALIGQAATIDDVWIGVLLAVLLFMLLLVYPTAIEQVTKGRSVGKFALGLRVVTVQGAPVRFRHSVIRGLLGLVEIFLFLGGPALAVALGSRRFQRLGDHMAGTVVIRERSGLPPAQPMRFLPRPEWEDFARGLDTSRMKEDEYRVVRTYLLRSTDLSPAVRVDLGRRLIRRIADRIGLSQATIAALDAHDPTQPLTAVAASYQRRFSPDPPAPVPAGWGS